MLRKLVSAAVLLALGIGVAGADETWARITKVDGNKITFTEFKNLKQGAEKTLPIDDYVKVYRGKFNPQTKKMAAGEPLEGGLKNEVFARFGKKGVAVFSTVVLVTDADNKKITEIRVIIPKLGTKDK